MIMTVMLGGVEGRVEVVCVWGGGTGGRGTTMHWLHHVLELVILTAAREMVTVIVEMVI